MSPEYPMRFCPRCDIGFSEEELQKTISAYVRSISPELRTGEEEYQRRLQCCKSCGSLSGSTCGLCGCFVASRAAKKAMHCPNPGNPYW